MLSSYASGSPGCLRPFPPCEGVKECPGFPSPLLPQASRENGVHCGLCPQAQPFASVSGLLWPLCLVCCGYWVRGARSAGSHFLTCCPLFRSVLGDGSCFVCPWVCPLIFSCLGKHSCGPVCRPELTLAADLRPCLERLVCCS